MNIQLKNIKYSKFASHETNCFEATGYVNGEKAFIAENDGQGGSTNILPLNRALTEQAEKYAKTLPATVFQDITIDADLEGLIDDLLEKFLWEKEIKRISKKSTIFKLPTEDSYRTVNAPYSEEVKKWVLGKYPTAEFILPAA